MTLPVLDIHEHSLKLLGRTQVLSHKRLESLGGVGSTYLYERDDFISRFLRSHTIQKKLNLRYQCLVLLRVGQCSASEDVIDGGSFTLQPKFGGCGVGRG